MIKISLAKRSSRGGFVLPIVLGFGVLILIVGLSMVVKSQGDRVTNSSQDATAQSQAIAEAGISIMQGFMNANRAIATYSACNTWSSQTCSDSSSAQTWATVATTSLGTTLTASGVTASPSTIAATATRQWRDVDSSNPAQGQYRLIDYTFTPSATPSPGVLGTGTLVVEGRVRQIGSGNTATTSAGTATTRLSVAMTVKSVPSSSGFPGLWVQTGSGTSASGSAAVNVDFRDSSSDGSATTNLQSYLYGTNTKTPGVGFPPLPGGGTFTAPTTGTGVYSIPAISLSGSGTYTLPQTGDTANTSNVYTYTIGTSGGKSINLSGSSYITVGQGTGDRVALYLQGSLNTSGGTQIRVTPGSKMTLYVNGDVTLSGGSTTNPPPIANSGGAENAQVYVYGSRTIQLSGGSNMSTFIFGPDSQVNAMSGGSNVTGAIWVNSWKASGSAYVNPGTVDQSQLEVQLPGGVAIEPPS